MVKVTHVGHLLKIHPVPLMLLVFTQLYSEESVSKIISDFADYPGFIFNLGHGITPDIDPDKVKVLVDAVREN